MSAAATALRKMGDDALRIHLTIAIAKAGSVDGAARILGISRRTAWRWVREFKIAPPRAPRG